LLLFLLLRKFCKLLFTDEKGKVCYFLLLFLLLVTFINYFLLLRRARVYILFIVQGGNLKGCTLIFFSFLFFIVEGEGVEVNVFLFR